MRKDNAFVGGEDVKNVKNTEKKEDMLFGPIQDYEITLLVYGVVLCLAFISVVWLIESHPFIAVSLGVLLYLFKHQLVKLL